MPADVPAMARDRVRSVRPRRVGAGVEPRRHRDRGRWQGDVTHARPPARRARAGRGRGRRSSSRPATTAASRSSSRTTTRTGQLGGNKSEPVTESVAWELPKRDPGQREAGHDPATCPPPAGPASAARRTPAVTRDRFRDGAGRPSRRCTASRRRPSKPRRTDRRRSPRRPRDGAKRRRDRRRGARRHAVARPATGKAADPIVGDRDGAQRPPKGSSCAARAVDATRQAGDDHGRRCATHDKVAPDRADRRDDAMTRRARASPRRRTVSFMSIDDVADAFAS